MKPTRFLLYPCLLFIDLIGWFLYSIAYLLWGESLYWEDGVLHSIMKDDSWFIRHSKPTWGASTCGHAIIARRNMAKTVFDHERVHVRQLEEGALASFALSAMVFIPIPWVAASCILALGPAVIYMAGWIVAVCYGGEAYRNNPQEEAAYDHEAAKNKE